MSAEKRCPFHAAAERLALLPNPSLEHMSLQDRAGHIAEYLHKLADLAKETNHVPSAYAIETLLLITSQITRVEPTEEAVPVPTGMFGRVKSGTA